jgi:TRAP-type C4-dicarboxylate transport system permease small subunit
MKKISRGIDIFLDKLIIVPAVMIGLVLLICTASVFLRNALPGAFYWSDEAMRYLMIYATFLALPILVQKKKNITIDLTDIIFPNNKKGPLCSISWPRS